MSIEFLLDTLKEDEKKDLKKVIDTIKTRPVRIDKNAVFLKNFVLAMMKQYEKPSILPHHQAMLKDLKEMKPIQVQRRYPMPPRKLKIVDEVPKELNLVEDNAVKPVDLVPDIPKPV